MSLTLTTTSEKTIPLILTMNKAPDFVEQLIDILEKYGNLDDSLSQSLYEWGVKILDDFSNKIITSELEMEGAKRINDLKKLLEGHESHEFANAMREWLKTLPELSKKMKPVTLSDLLVISASLDNTNQAMLESMKEQEELAKQLSAFNIKIIQSAKETAHREVKQAQEDIAKLEELSDRRYKVAKEIQKETLGIQVERICKLQQKLQITEERVTKAEEKSLKHEAEIKRLRDCYAQSQREIDALRNQGSGGGKRCVIQ